MDPQEIPARTLRTNKCKNSIAGKCLTLDAVEQSPDESVRRYEKLAHAVKAYVFTVIVRNAHALCTIHYPGVAQVTGYTAEEYASQPSLWFTMICSEDKDIVQDQVARLLRGETPPPVKHRITHKNGSVRWLKNTSIPAFNSQGSLIGYDGLIVDISETASAQAEQEHQIAELTTALTMIKRLHNLLPICSSCKKIRDDKGYWKEIDDYISGHFPAISFTHGICPACAKRLYPEYYDEICKSA